MEKKKEDSQETEVREPLSEETELAEIENDEGAEIKDESAEEEEIEETLPPREKAGEEYIDERIYTIPLQRAWILPAKKRAPKAIRIIKAFVQRHMKVEEVVDEDEGGRIIISNEVNRKIWSRGIEKPPRKLRIRAAKDEKGNVTIFLA